MTVENLCTVMVGFLQDRTHTRRVLSGISVSSCQQNLIPGPLLTQRLHTNFPSES